MSSDENDEDFQGDSDSSYGSASDSDESYGKKKKKTKKGKNTGRKGRPLGSSSSRKPKEPKVAEDDFPVVKRRKSNEDLTDDQIRERVLECFSQRERWTKKNLRLTLGIQLWKFQKFLDEMCTLEDDGKEYTLNSEFRPQ